MAYDTSNGHVTVVHCPAPAWMVVWRDRRWDNNC